MWHSVVNRKFVEDRSIHSLDFELVGVLELLRSQNLLQSVTYAKPFVKSVVYEFYANLQKAILDPDSDSYHKVYLRGKSLDFSPSRINEFLLCSRDDSSSDLDFKLVISSLTGKAKTAWPSAAFPASDLSLKFSVLHKAAVRNWMPSLHTTSIKKSLAALLYKVGHSIPFNLGELIFSQIIDFAEDKSVSSALIFPSLIFEILSSQADILLPSDLFEPTLPEIRISRKLFKGSHVSNIDSTGNEASVEGEPSENPSPEVFPDSVPENVATPEYDAEDLAAESVPTPSAPSQSSVAQLRAVIKGELQAISEIERTTARRKKLLTSLLASLDN